MEALETYFCPDMHFDRTPSVDLDMLWDKGIRGLILDLDNTLVALRSSDVPEDVCAWAKRAREKGFQLCIASNTRRYARLAKIADALGATYVTQVAKPRRGGFRNALWKMKLATKQVAVIGDQLLTDILAANRMGLTSILVDRMTDQEFFVTRFNRRIERLILNNLMRAGKMPPRACQRPLKPVDPTNTPGGTP